MKDWLRGELHTIQQAFNEKGHSMWFLFAGDDFSYKSLLEQNPNPTTAEIKEADCRNICRCMLCADNRSNPFACSLVGLVQFPSFYQDSESRLLKKKDRWFHYDGYNFIGKRIPRVDGLAKATGKATYTVDVKLQGMLYGKILRSPYPHARLLKIDTTAAQQLPGVRAVITGEDVRQVRYAFVDTPRYPADEQPLAVDKVRYIGDEVAAVAAESEAIAEKALSLIKVEYEILPPVFHPEEAMQEDAPIIHDEQFVGISFWEEWGVAQQKGAAKQENSINNLSGHTSIIFGDVEQAFQEADYSREDRFELKATAHCQMEPHAAVASYDPLAGKLHVWLSTMGIFLKRHFLSRTLNLPASKIRVHHTFVGGAFGGKIDLFPYEFCAAYLSMKTGKRLR